MGRIGSGFPLCIAFATPRCLTNSSAPTEVANSEREIVFGMVRNADVFDVVKDETSNKVRVDTDVGRPQRPAVCGRLLNTQRTKDALAPLFAED